MDPISQGAIGAIAPQVVLRGEKIRAVALLGCLAGIAPDADVFINSTTDPLLLLEYHHAKAPGIAAAAGIRVSGTAA